MPRETMPGGGNSVNGEEVFEMEMGGDWGESGGGDRGRIPVLERREEVGGQDRKRVGWVVGEELGVEVLGVVMAELG